MGEPQELDEFLSWTPPALKPIVSGGLFYKGSKGIIYGRYKSLKSMLAIRFCLAVSAGAQWLGFDTVASNVMYLQYEIVPTLLQERFKQMVQTRSGVNGHKLWVWTEASLKLDQDSGYKRIEEIVEKYRPEVLVIDPIYKLVSGDLLSTNHIQKLVDLIDVLMDKYELSIMLVHHTRKGSGDGWGSDDMLGSTIFSAWADSVIEIERIEHKIVNVKFKAIRHAKNELTDKRFEVDMTNIDFIESQRYI